MKMYIMNHENSIPVFYIFSYWIFIWSIIFIAIKYFYQFSSKQMPYKIKWFNPSLVLLIALIWNTESLIRLIVNNNPLNIILKYTLVIILIKLIPLWLVWTWDMNLYRDMTIALLIFIFYCVYLWFNRTNLFEVYLDLTKSIENDENRTPLEYAINKLFGI